MDHHGLVVSLDQARVKKHVNSVLDSHFSARRGQDSPVPMAEVQPQLSGNGRSGGGPPNPPVTQDRLSPDIGGPDGGPLVIFDLIEGRIYIGETTYGSDQGCDEIRPAIEVEELGPVVSEPSANVSKEVEFTTLSRWTSDLTPDWCAGPKLEDTETLRRGVILGETMMAKSLGDTLSQVGTRLLGSVMPDLSEAKELAHHLGKSKSLG